MAAPPIFRALEWLGWLNLIWAAVNLLPAFPLDGGHLFYGAIEKRGGRQRALFWTGVFGIVFAIMAKVIFIGGLLTGMVIWSPPYLSPNWERRESRSPRQRDYCQAVKALEADNAAIRESGLYGFPADHSTDKNEDSGKSRYR